MHLEILHPPQQIKVAGELIETIKKRNKFTYEITLQLDYNMPEDSGEYNSKIPNVIKINPYLCTVAETFSYLEDNTIFGVIMHEFSHFLSMTYFVDFQKNYLEAFPETRLLLTKYEAANEDYDEEIAEVMSLFIRNPYLLKIISKDHYKFLNTWFISPVPCTSKRFIYMFNKLPIDCKNRLRTKWGIIVNHAEQKVYKDLDAKPHPVGFIMKP
jgi:hypothetical protein